MPSRVNLSVYTAKEKRERERATEREREREKQKEARKSQVQNANYLHIMRFFPLIFPLSVLLAL